MKLSFFTKIILQIFITMLSFLSIYYALKLKEEPQSKNEIKKSSFCDNILLKDLQLDDFSTIKSAIEKINTEICNEDANKNNETIDEFLFRILKKYTETNDDNFTPISPHNFCSKKNLYLKFISSEDHVTKDKSLYRLDVLNEIYENLPQKIKKMTLSDFFFQLHVFEMLKTCGNLSIFNTDMPEKKMNEFVANCMLVPYYKGIRKCLFEKFQEKEIIEKILSLVKKPLDSLKPKQNIFSLNLENINRKGNIDYGYKNYLSNRILFSSDYFNISLYMQDYFKELQNFCNDKNSKELNESKILKEFQENMYSINKILFEELVGKYRVVVKNK